MKVNDLLEAAIEWHSARRDYLQMAWPTDAATTRLLAAESRLSDAIAAFKDPK